MVSQESSIIEGLQIKTSNQTTVIRKNTTVMLRNFRPHQHMNYLKQNFEPKANYQSWRCRTIHLSGIPKTTGLWSWQFILSERGSGEAAKMNVESARGNYWAETNALQRTFWQQKQLVISLTRLLNFQPEWNYFPSVQNWSQKNRKLCRSETMIRLT